jgi:hypothetical protein
MFSHHRWQIRFQMSPMQQLSIKKAICLKEHKGNKKGYIMSTCVKNKKFNVPILVTGTCFIQKIYAPSSSLLQGKHLPFPTSPQYFLLICDPFADPIISLHSRDISLYDCHIWIYLPGPPQTNWTWISANVACFIFKSLKRIQPLPVCAGFFICIRNSLDRPCVTMPSW